MKIFFLFLLVLAPLSGWAIDDYYWTTPSHNSTESMPVGGGNIGMNVWVDSLSNQVLCYVSQSGWFDENNTLLKAGLLRITWDDAQTFYAPEFNPFFEQRLCLNKGHQLIRFAESELHLWVDVWKPIIHIEADAPIQVEYESWRLNDTPLNRSNGQQSSWKWIVPKGAVTHADHVQRETGEDILFWHQNLDTTVFDYTVHQQQLEAYRDQLYNPLKGRIFGGHLKQHNPEHYTLTLYNAQYNTGTRTQQWEAWHQQLLDIENSIDPANDRKETQRWWSLYWHHSFIEAGPHCSDSVRLMIRNYNLFRYLLGCNAHPSSKGERWPTKFNGGLFTFHPLEADPSLFETEQETPGTFTPDYRKWGGGTHTAQNQRLVYWPLLQTGNYEALHAQFDYYLRLLPTAQLRSQHYWGIEGACFCEQLENFGLPNPAEYGRHKNGGDPGIEDNKWLEYEWDTALEFAQMMLLSRYKDAIPFALSCLKFFDHFYQREAQYQWDPLTNNYCKADPNAQLSLYPGSGCETYKRARNAASTVAALHRVTATLLQQPDVNNHHKGKRRRTSPQRSLTPQQRSYLLDLQQRLPALPTRKLPGATPGDSVLCYAPAESWEYIQNVETPQLYPVWPWRMADTLIGRNTYRYDPDALEFRDSKGWKQDNIWAACLGFTDQAFQLTAQKLLAHPYRFPAFWGPGFDWMPDHNWGGSAMIGLHEMLYHEDPDGTLHFLPAWPKDQDIHFRLYDTKGIPFEVVYQDGKLTQKKLSRNEKNNL